MAGILQLAPSSVPEKLEEMLARFDAAAFPTGGEDSSLGFYTDGARRRLHERWRQMK